MPATDPAAWRAFLHASARILDRLDSELQAAHGLTLCNYEIISNLSETDDDRMRMTQLARVPLVSKNRLTYRVNDVLHGVAAGSTPPLAPGVIPARETPSAAGAHFS